MKTGLRNTSRFIIWAVIVAFFAYVFWHDPFYKKIDPVDYEVNLVPEFSNNLKINDHLEKAEFLFQNQIYWPESLAVKEGVIYTGLGDGRIVKIDGSALSYVTQIGKVCDGQHEEHICGRPLGMEFSEAGLLYVADAYYGLYAVNVTTGETEMLLSSLQNVDGKPLTFLNSVALDEKNGLVYITQSSTKFNISMVITSIVDHDMSGRVLVYNMKTKKIHPYYTGLAFPNGVALTKDKKGIIVAEGSKTRVIRFTHSKNSLDKFGKKEVILILPGEPDNITPSKRGNYWIAIGNGRTSESPTIYDSLCHKPKLRVLMLIFHHMVFHPLTTLVNLIPRGWCARLKECLFEISTGRAVADISKFHTLIVEFDDNGNILRSLHSPAGKLGPLSDVLEHNGHLYLGSWRNNYLAKLKFNV